MSEHPYEEETAIVCLKLWTSKKVIRQDSLQDNAIEIVLELIATLFFFKISLLVEATPHEGIILFTFH